VVIMVYGSSANGEQVRWRSQYTKDCTGFNDSVDLYRLYWEFVRMDWWILMSIGQTAQTNPQREQGPHEHRARLHGIAEPTFHGI